MRSTPKTTYVSASGAVGVDRNEVPQTASSWNDQKQMSSLCVQLIEISVERASNGVLWGLSLIRDTGSC